MSSKRAMRQAQKQAYAKHRSNIKIVDLNLRKNLLPKTKKKKKIKTNFLDQISLFFYNLRF